MAQKRYRPEEIIATLREAAVLIGRGRTVPAIVETTGISQVSYCRWLTGTGLELLGGQALQASGAPRHKNRRTPSARHARLHERPGYTRFSGLSRLPHSTCSRY